jgi:uncharacterized protein (DUF433 family)
MSLPHVSVRPEDGQPCFEGTSTPIDVLFANLAAGERLDVILDHFPTIRREAAVAVCAKASVWFAKRRCSSGALARPSRESRRRDAPWGLGRAASGREPGALPKALTGAGLMLAAGSSCPKLRGKAPKRLQLPSRSR